MPCSSVAVSERQIASVAEVGGYMSCGRSTKCSAASSNESSATGRSHSASGTPVDGLSGLGEPRRTER